MRNRMHHAWSLLAVVLATVMMGCSDQGGDSGTSTSNSSNTTSTLTGGAGLTKLTLKLNWVPEPQFGGFYEAALGGHFEKHGLDVDVQRASGGEPTIQQVVSGQVDYAIAAADQVVMARTEGLSVVAVYAAYQTSPRAIMVHKSKGFETIGDIFADKSMTLAMEPGRNFSDFLKSMYSFDNIDIVPYAGAMERFTTDENFGMQCFATSEPLEAKNRGIEAQVFNVAEAGYNPYMTVVIVSDERLKEKPEEVRKVVAAIRDGWAGYVKDPTKTNAAMHRMNDTMDAATFKAAAEAQVSLVMPETGEADLGKMTTERWSTLIKQLVDLKVIDTAKAPSAAACFTNPAAPASMAAASTATTQPAE